jgi:hypothetical protein
VTPRRTIAIGLGGALAVVAAGAAGNVLGAIVQQILGEEWAGHATTHIVFGALALAIGLLVGRVRHASLASAWAGRGLAAVRLSAFVVSVTAVVEGVGAYPPLATLHDIVYANLWALLALLLGFIFVAAVGVGNSLRGVGTPRPS